MKLLYTFSTWISFLEPQILGKVVLNKINMCSKLFTLTIVIFFRDFDPVHFQRSLSFTILYTSTCSTLPTSITGMIFGIIYFRVKQYSDRNHEVMIFSHSIKSSVSKNKNRNYESQNKLGTRYNTKLLLQKVFFYFLLLFQYTTLKFEIITETL